MGIGRRLGRGLAAGLTTLGAGMHRDEQEEENKRRFEQQEARAERQLQLQEAAAKQTAEMNKPVSYTHLTLPTTPYV